MGRVLETEETSRIMTWSTGYNYKHVPLGPFKGINKRFLSD